MWTCEASPEAESACPFPDSELNGGGNRLTTSNYQQNGYSKWRNHVFFLLLHKRQRKRRQCMLVAISRGNDSTCERQQAVWTFRVLHDTALRWTVWEWKGGSRSDTISISKKPNHMKRVHVDMQIWYNTFIRWGFFHVIMCIHFPGLTSDNSWLLRYTLSLWILICQWEGGKQTLENDFTYLICLDVYLLQVQARSVQWLR